MNSTILRRIKAKSSKTCIAHIAELYNWIGERVHKSVHAMLDWESIIQ